MRWELVQFDYPFHHRSPPMSGTAVLFSDILTAEEIRKCNSVSGCFLTISILRLSSFLPPYPLFSIHSAHRSMARGLAWPPAQPLRCSCHVSDQCLRMRQPFSGLGERLCILSGSLSEEYSLLIFCVEWESRRDTATRSAR